MSVQHAGMTHALPASPGAPDCAQSGEFGYFVGEVVARWAVDGRNMILTESFEYIDPHGQRWDAPGGSVIDGASIPRIVWSAIGGPFEGMYRNASVIHDVACVRRNRHWEEVHLAFYTAMLASGVDCTKAKIMFAAVYHFGPRWDANAGADECGPDGYPGSVDPLARVAKALGAANSKNPGQGLGAASLMFGGMQMQDARKNLRKEDFDRIALQILVHGDTAEPMTIEQIKSFY